ncbi:MAG: tyrosine-type recombinase/integrase [Deltaproteobacteria bacterium]|nr:tyrosine-type recombinase/integrase [Deltaproteobacteria bacterium]
MNAFNSFLAKQLDDYVAYRQSLGFSTNPFRAYLKMFDRYLDQRQKEPVLLQPSFFLELRSDLNLEARTVNRVISTARMFFGYLVRCGNYTTNPVKDIPLLPKNEIIPFIFSDEQVDQLLLSVCKAIRKDSRYFIKDLSVYLAFLLLANCGMRISEPLRLLKHHYRQSERTLYIEKTKFKKDRLIPIPKEVDTHVKNYLKVRDKLWGDHHNPYLLAGSKYGGLGYERIRQVFRQSVKTIGLDQPRRVIGHTNFSAPTIHSLRHSFAVNTLLRIKARKASPQHALPVLATYMGHVEYRYTANYLKMIDADQRRHLLDFVQTQKR